MSGQPKLSQRDALMHIRERAFRLAKITCPDTCSEWEHPLCWIARTADAALRAENEPCPAHSHPGCPHCHPGKTVPELSEQFVAACESGAWRTYLDGLEKILTSARPSQPPVPVQFPRDNAGPNGWTIQCSFLKQVLSAADAQPDPWNLSLEQVEAVLLALETVTGAGPTKEAKP